MIAYKVGDRVKDNRKKGPTCCDKVCGYGTVVDVGFVQIEIKWDNCSNPDQHSTYVSQPIHGGCCRYSKNNCDPDFELCDDSISSTSFTVAKDRCSDFDGHRVVLAYGGTPIKHTIFVATAYSKGGMSCEWATNKASEEVIKSALRCALVPICPIAVLPIEVCAKIVEKRAKDAREIIASAYFVCKHCQ